jgi:hypothetical protein
MNQWGVGDFVSRVADRVTTAREGIAAQIVELGEHRAEDDTTAFLHLQAAFPLIEPSPEFVADLYRRLMAAPLGVEDSVVEASVGPDRRIVYGVAAVGSLASAVVVAALVWRTRVVHRAA